MESVDDRAGRWPEGREAGAASTVGFALGRYLETPVAWLADAPCSPREALLILETSSRARSFERSFEVYVQLARRKANLEGAWRDVAGGKDLEINAAFPFLSDLLRSSRDARVQVLRDLANHTDVLVQHAEELSKFSKVNRSFSERLRRKAVAATDAAIRRALEEEYAGRHVLSECEREVARRIREITKLSGADGGSRIGDLQTMADFLRDLELRHRVGPAGDAEPGAAEDEEERVEVPDSQEEEEEAREGAEPTTLTIRGGIDAEAKRRRVSETPDNTPAYRAGGQTPGSGLRLTDAVKDLEVDSSIHMGVFASHSSDDSRKTPTLTPNQTALPGPGENPKSPNRAAAEAKKLDSVTKQGRSPWATPGLGRGRGKDSQTDDSGSAGKRKGKKTKASGSKGEEVGCALNFDDVQMDEPAAKVSNSLSAPSPSPPLTAST